MYTTFKDVVQQKKKERKYTFLKVFFILKGNTKKGQS